jgi:4-hydroxybenzoyl-CoA thioesterase
MRGDLLLCEGTEVRAFDTHHPDDPVRLKAIAPPEDIVALCR